MENGGVNDVAMQPLNTYYSNAMRAERTPPPPPPSYFPFFFLHRLSPERDHKAKAEARPAATNVKATLQHRKNTERDKTL